MLYSITTPMAMTIAIGLQSENRLSLRASRKTCETTRQPTANKKDWNKIWNAVDLAMM